MRSSLCGLAAVATVLAGCASSPPPRFDDGVPYDVPPPPRAASPVAAPVRAPYDGFDHGPLLAAPAFTPASDGDTEQRRTAERLAQNQRATLVTETRSPASDAPRARGVPAQGHRAPRSDGAVGYWDQAGSAPRGEAPQQPSSGGPLTVPETLSADSESVGTGGAAIPPPPEVRPGECVALVRQPAQYRTVQRDFELRPPADRLQIDPARYVVDRQTVTTQEGYEKLEVIPATYRIVTEQIEVAPATTRYVPSEPVYQSVTERVQERPARSVWKLGRGKVEKVDDASGEVQHLVEEPAVYRTVTRQVLKQPAQLREIVVPAQTRSVTRRVIDRPEQVRRVWVPAQQTALPVQRVVGNAQVTRVAVPGQTASYGVQEQVSAAELEWRPVLCETSVTPELIRRVQIQLTAAGFEPGVANGLMGPRTVAALNAYQRQRGLPEDRYLNVETARALGVWEP